MNVMKDSQKVEGSNLLSPTPHHIFEPVKSGLREQVRRSLLAMCPSTILGPEIIQCSLATECISDQFGLSFEEDIFLSLSNKDLAIHHSHYIFDVVLAHGSDKVFDNV